MKKGRMERQRELTVDTRTESKEDAGGQKGGRVRENILASRQTERTVTVWVPKLQRSLSLSLTRP